MGTLEILGIILVLSGVLYLFLQGMGKLSDKGGEITNKLISVKGSSGLILVAFGVILLWLGSGNPQVVMSSTNQTVTTPINTPTTFAVSTTNVGTTATNVSVNVHVPSSISGLAYQVNQTNATTGAIIGPATGLTISSGAQPTFAVFITPTKTIPFDPANNRLTLQLVDSNGRVIGSQSVNISTT